MREGGRSGVVGREGIVPERERECEALRVWAVSFSGVVLVVVDAMAVGRR